MLLKATIHAAAYLGLVVGMAMAQTCPQQGDARSEPVRQLDLLKNRTATPTSSDIDGNVTLQAILAPGNDVSRFDERRAAVIEGIVVRVLPGGIETANCHARDLDHRDTHIELALSPTAPSTERVIIEVTPWWRAAMARQGADWRTQSLNVNLIGRRVRVTGWLLLDRMHLDESRNTASDNPKDWRATAWEIHPITAITVLP